MNYFIEKHDMEIILDALELLHIKVKQQENLHNHFNYPYTSEYIDNLFQSFDNSFTEKS